MQQPYDYLTCPNCSQRIREPFSLHSGPIAFVHYGKRNGERVATCRLIVIPDPIHRQHRIHVVPWGTSLEDALAAAIEMARAA